MNCCLFKPKLTLPWLILAKFDLVQPAFLLFIHNSYSALKMVWKDGLILVFRLLKRCLAILGQFWPNFRLKRTKLTIYSIHLGVLSKIHTQYLKLCGNMSLFGFLGFLKLYLVILDQCLTCFWPNLTLNSHCLDFLCEIYTQLLKLCGKVVLLGSLGLLMQFWPFWVNFGPILAKMSQIWLCRANIQYFYVKSTLTACNCAEKWSYLAL